MLAVLSGCATGPGVVPLLPSQGERQQATLTLADGPVLVEWHLPAGPARGLVTLQHGYSRRCEHLRDLATQFTRQGFMTICFQASMAGGNPLLADALAPVLASPTLRAPNGVAVPNAIVVAGHSAGGHFAVRLGVALSRLAPQRLRGAVLLDPVGGRGFEADLQALSAQGTTPLWASLAPSSPCNAGGQARGPLSRLPTDRVHVETIEGATHLDAEGANTDALAVAACGEGRPQPERVQSLHARATAAALQFSNGKE